MHEILTKQNLEASLRLCIPVEVTCEHGHTCCVRGELLHDVTTDIYSYRDGGTLFSNTTHLENLWCVTNMNNGSYRFFTETPVHSLILKKETAMRVGDIITKEQFLRLAPLGLQITSNVSGHSNVILGYCHKNYKAFTKYQEQGNTLPSKVVPGYCFLHEEEDQCSHRPEGVTRTHLRDYWSHIENGEFIIHRLPNIQLLKRKLI